MASSAGIRPLEGHSRLVLLKESCTSMDPVAILIFSGFVIGFIIIAAEDFG